VIREAARTIISTLKSMLRRFVPDFLLKKRDIIHLLGPKAGRIYTRLCLLDMLGIRSANKRLVPQSARSFIFVCHGNIMRSAMAEFFMRQTLQEMGLEQEVHVTSAGLHACAGREAHIWAQEASADLGISLAEHRAKPLTQKMVDEADCILAMDFRNKAELLALYPESREKIYMLSAYSEGSRRYREIPDPYLGDLETTRSCARQLETCIGNLIQSIFHHLLTPENEETGDARKWNAKGNPRYRPRAISPRDPNLRTPNVRR
jgi:protein-tyrosine-phosphatase